MFQLNTLAPGRFEWNFRKMIIKLVLVKNHVHGSTFWTLYILQDWGDYYCANTRTENITTTKQGTTKPRIMGYKVIVKIRFAIPYCWKLLNQYLVVISLKAHHHQTCTTLYAKKSVNFQSDAMISTLNLVASILREMFRWDVLLLYRLINAWWRHQMETFSPLLAICAGNLPVSGKFPTQRPVSGALMFSLS